ncbi:MULTISPECIES: hypothetical protein [Hymenobacter]|uniref:hypothetical protein n=1 Tax=Hymenobacter TaxID=89966 RepID=UPI00105883B7|nr:MULTISPECIES: hypothetical protein [Hymenobacter]QIL75699.1 hypothetical protein G7064_07435 [Hymenobacter sp. HDW8]
MKRTIYHLLLLLVTAITLASCEKEEENFRVTPPTQIIFDDFIDKNTADYKVTGNIDLKISAPGASTVRILSTYTGGSKDLGTLAIANGSATLSIPARSVRTTGTVVGAGSNPTSTRAANTYTFKVDATMPDASVATRYFTAVIVQ